jgi:hypothetical protein
LGRFQVAGHPVFGDEKVCGIDRDRRSGKATGCRVAGGVTCVNSQFELARSEVNVVLPAFDIWIFITTPARFDMSQREIGLEGASIQCTA